MNTKMRSNNFNEMTTDYKYKSKDRARRQGQTGTDKQHILKASCQ